MMDTEGSEVHINEIPQPIKAEVCMLNATNWLNAPKFWTLLVLITVVCSAPTEFVCQSTGK